MGRLTAILFAFILQVCAISLHAQNNEIEVILQRGVDNWNRTPTNVDAISHDDKWVLASNNSSHTIIIWNLIVSRIYATYSFGPKITSAIFLKNNNDVLINDSIILNIHSGKIVRRLPMLNALAANYVVKDHKYSGWGKLTYDVERSGDEIHNYRDTLIKKYNNSSGWNPLCYCVNKNNSLLWGSENGIIYCYDIGSERIVGKITAEAGTISSLDYVEEKNTLIIGGSTRTCLYNLKTGKALYIDGNLLNLSYTPILDYVSGFMTGQPQSIRFWKVDDKVKLIHSYPLNEKIEAPTYARFLNCKSALMVINNIGLKEVSVDPFSIMWADPVPASSFEISATGKYLVVRQQDNKYGLYDIRSMKNLVDDSKFINSVELSNDDRYALLSGYKDNKALWELQDLVANTTEEIMVKDTVQRDYGSGYIDALFRADTDQIIFYSDTRVIYLYDIQHKTFSKDSLRFPVYPYSSLINSADGKYVINQSTNNPPRIYFAENFQCLSEQKHETEQTRFATDKGDNVVVLGKEDDFNYDIHLFSTSTDSAKEFHINGKVLAFNASHTGAMCAYVAQRLVGYEYIPYLYTIDTRSMTMTDSVKLPKEEAFASGQLIFDRNMQDIYLGMGHLYKYDLISKQLATLQPGITGMFYPINTNINDSYIFGYEDSGISKTNKVHLAVINLTTMRSELNLESHLYAYQLTALYNQYFKSYPDIFCDDFKKYISATDASPRYVTIDKPFIFCTLADANMTDDKRKVLVVLGSNEFRVYDSRTFDVLSTIKSYDYANIGFTANKKYAYTTHSGKSWDGDILKIFDVAKGFKKIPFIYEAGKERAYLYLDSQVVWPGERMELSNNGAYLAVLNSNVVPKFAVYDFNDAKKKRLFEYESDDLLNKDTFNVIFNALTELAFSADEQKVVCATYKKYMLRVDVKTGEIQKLTYEESNDADTWHIAIGQSGNWVAALVNDTARLVNDPFRGLLPANDRGRLLVWDKSGKYKVAKTGISSMDNTATIITIYEKDNLICLKEQDGLHFYNLSTLQKVKEIISPDIINYDVDTNSILTVNMANKKDNAYRLPGFETEKVPHKTDDYKITTNQQFQYITLDTTVVAKFLFDNTNDEMLWFCPNNYYYVNKASNDAIAFKYDHDLYPASVFDAVYNRPDTILSALQPIFHFSKDVINMYKTAYSQRSGDGAVRENPLQFVAKIPRMQFNTLGKDLSTNEKKYVTKITADGINTEVASYNIMINGVPLYGVKGHSFTGNLKEEITIPLLPGKNFIEGILTNKDGLNSLPASMTIDLHDSTSFNPTTYFIGIGAGKYQYTKDSLYADKDAEDLAAVMARRDGNAKIKTLVNDSVTKSKILALRKDLLLTKPEDKIILYYSGHGIINNGLYLGTSDMNFEEPAAKGLKIDDLYNLIDSIPARNKLILLDACHSGQLYGEQVNHQQVVTAKNDTAVYLTDIMDNVFTDCNNLYGINTIAAAEGSNFAMQPGSTHGYFTAALLKAIITNLDNSTDMGKISIKDLKRYVVDSVSAATLGNQKPNSRNENDKIDWEF